MVKDILFVSFESLPFIKTGGLADVVYALPKAINNKKFKVKIVLPLLKKIKDKYIYDLKPVGHIYINTHYIHEEANILSYTNEGIEYLFIENDTFFYRDGVYGYDDDAARFSFFNLAIIEMMFNLNYFPDIIHCHDYHSGVLAALCKLRFNNVPQINKIKHIYTIHNLAFQGIYDKNVLFDLLGFSYLDYANGSLRYNNDTNFMKIALEFSDVITTVSNTYAQEIKTKEYGEGLDSLLRGRSNDLCGVINGIDTLSFNPKNDSNLITNYDLRNFVSGKKKCKKDLQQTLGLNINPDIFVLGIVSRLTNQKGIDLILKELKHILQMDIQLVVLGTGESIYENSFKEMEYNHKGKAVYYCGYNEALAHKIYAGIDMLLMPSQFEPCGISQLISQRYGTLPLVRETGGLKDTVNPFNKYEKTGDGFSFNHYSSYNFKQVLDIAYNLYYQDTQTWRKLIKNAMKKDVSFSSSARDYENIYNWVLNR